MIRPLPILMPMLAFVTSLFLNLSAKAQAVPQVAVSSTGYYNNFSTNVNTAEQTFSVLSWGNTGATFAIASNQLDINLASMHSWVYFENKLTNPINITTLPMLTVVVKGSFTNSAVQQYLYVQIVDNTGKTSINSLQSILPINAGFSPYNLDFSTIGYAAGFNKTAVKSVRFYVVNSMDGCCATDGLSGKITMSAIKLGNIDVSDPNIGNGGNGWTTLGANMIYTNKDIVYIGENADDEPTLTTPYYRFTVNGLTNIIGDDNALEIWSKTKSNTPVGGRRQYLSFNNKTYANGFPYGAIGSNSFKKGIAIENQITDLIFQPSGGKVGIGTFTQSPEATLHVNGDVKMGNVVAGNINSGNIISHGADFVLGLNDGRAQGIKLTQRALVHDDANQDKLIINYNGDFEGGTVIQSNLQVTGKIATQEVCVNPTSSWCDYVFEKNYKLMPLKELSLYINQYKHLPEVPTTAEVEKGGVNLGEINVLYLKKIEELTLYLIELQKQVDELKKLK